ncbi:hypothetical protein AMEX_G16183 [Astyanax mexicanus]|uniref:Uncharacterized protein n=1 Tax=Astyanax mexicanus TaxID=7994 RepID=A0A8T2LB16_ASTMX|nr:hypothetical protein AMEX_G16183 [Astyanax mexicanus]
MGNIQHSVAEPENVEQLYLAHLDWDECGLPEDPPHGITVPTTPSPLIPEELAALKSAINPLGHSESYGADIYLATIQYIQNILGQI